MSSVTGTMTNFSPRTRSEKPPQLSASGPLKSACIARMKVTAVKRRPSTAMAVKKAAVANEPLKMRNSPTNPLSPGKPSDENIRSEERRVGKECRYRGARYEETERKKRT